MALDTTCEVGSIPFCQSPSQGCWGELSMVPQALHEQAVGGAVVRPRDAVASWAAASICSVLIM